MRINIDTNRRANATERIQKITHYLLTNLRLIQSVMRAVKCERAIMLYELFGYN